MWKVSYTRDDCDVGLVMDGLKIDRGAPSTLELTKIQYEQAKEKFYAEYGAAKETLFSSKKQGNDGYHSSDESDNVSSGEDLASAEC